jgi:hypothetical protein
MFFTCVQWIALGESFPGVVENPSLASAVFCYPRKVYFGLQGTRAPPLPLRSPLATYRYTFCGGAVRGGQVKMKTSRFSAAASA